MQDMSQSTVQGKIYEATHSKEDLKSPLQTCANSYGDAAARACNAVCALAEEFAALPMASPSLSVAVGQFRRAVTDAATQQRAALKQQFDVAVCDQESASENLMFEFTGLSKELDQLHRQQLDQRVQQQQQAVYERLSSCTRVQQTFLQCISTAFDHMIQASVPDPVRNVPVPQETCMIDLLDGAPSIATQDRHKEATFDDLDATYVGLDSNLSPNPDTGVHVESLDLLNDVDAAGTMGGGFFGAASVGDPDFSPILETNSQPPDWWDVLDQTEVGAVCTGSVGMNTSISEPSQLMDATVQEDEHVDEDVQSIEFRVQQWQAGKNLRALLASVHEVAPPGTWKERTLGDLLDARHLRATYKDALLAFHPDKLPPRHKVLGQRLVDALVTVSRRDK